MSDRSTEDRELIEQAMRTQFGAARVQTNQGQVDGAVDSLARLRSLWPSEQKSLDPDAREAQAERG